MSEIQDALRKASILLASAARADFAALDDKEVCSVLSLAEEVGRFADTARVQIASEVADRSRFELGDAGLSMRLGHRMPVHLIEERTRASQAEIFRRMRLGDVIRPRVSFLGELLPGERPHVGAAMLEGSLGIDSARAIVSALKQACGGTEATPERMDAAEQSLVEAARVDGADLVAAEGRLWRDALDPDGIEPRFEDTVLRRGVTIGRERNGLTDIHLKADSVSTALIKTALADSTVPGAAPRFLSEEDAARARMLVEGDDGESGEVHRDPRTREQKQFDILLGIITAGVRATHGGPASLRTTGSVTATVTLKQLADGVGAGWLDGTLESIPIAMIRELACDAGLRIAVLGNAGEPLYLGRRERLYTTAQRRLLGIRDGGCVVRGCHAPPSWCHAHHVKPWQSGGRTDIDNGVLLCPAHHHALHSGGFEIEIREGRPWLRRKFGTGPDGEWRPARGSRVLQAAA